MEPDVEFTLTGGWKDWPRQLDDRPPLPDGPLHADVAFKVEPTKRRPLVRRTWPLRQPGVIRLLRYLFEPMVERRLLADSARIVEVVASKDFDEPPRVEVRVWSALRLHNVAPKNPLKARRGAAWEARQRGEA